jgi:mRNA interferase RelE/StbE
LAYRIEIRPKVEKALRKLPEHVVRAVKRAIDGLANDPRPPGAKRLSAREEWKIRVGDYRVLYLIEDARLTIMVVKVGHRSDVYRRR